MEVIPCWIQNPLHPPASPKAPLAPGAVTGRWQERRSPGRRKHFAETAGKHLSPRPPGDPPTDPHLHSLPQSCPVPVPCARAVPRSPTAKSCLTLPSVTPCPQLGLSRVQPCLGMTQGLRLGLCCTCRDREEAGAGLGLLPAWGTAGAPAGT